MVKMTRIFKRFPLHIFVLKVSFMYGMTISRKKRMNPPVYIPATGN